MKDIDLSELFCEVLGGGLTIVLAIAILDLSGRVDVTLLFKDASAGASLGTVTVAVIGSYLVGLLMDAVSLALGEWRFDQLVGAGEPPSPEQVKQFWRQATEHILKYRDHQWTFYSAYRTVFLLLLPGIVILPLVVCKHASLWWSVLSATLLIGLEVSLFLSARCLLTLYYSLTKQFS